MSCCAGFVFPVMHPAHGELLCGLQVSHPLNCQPDKHSSTTPSASAPCVVLRWLHWSASPGFRNFRSCHGRQAQPLNDMRGDSLRKLPGQLWAAGCGRRAGAHPGDRRNRSGTSRRNSRRRAWGGRGRTPGHTGSTAPLPPAACPPPCPASHPPAVQQRNATLTHGVTSKSRLAAPHRHQSELV